MERIRPYNSEISPIESAILTDLHQFCLDHNLTSRELRDALTKYNNVKDNLGPKEHLTKKTLTPALLTTVEED